MSKRRSHMARVARQLAAEELAYRRDYEMRPNKLRNYDDTSKESRKGVAVKK